MTKLVDREHASAIMEERNIDILVGTGYINYGYIPDTLPIMGWTIRGL